MYAAPAPRKSACIFTYKHNRKTMIMQNAALPKHGGYCIIKIEEAQALHRR